MSKEKYEDANILTFQKLGLPSFVQQQVIVSEQEIENARKCILLLKRKIKRLLVVPIDSYHFEPVSPVWIPYQEYLGESLPNSKGVEMRSAKYIGSLLQVIALAKSNFQLKHSDGKEAIATPEHLMETLQMIQDHLISDYSGIPTQKRKFLEEIFYPCYDEKDELEELLDGSKTESIVAVTTRDLADYHRRVWDKGIDPNNLQKRYLDELVINDLIGRTASEIDRRRQIYFPLTDRSADRIKNNGKDAGIKKFKNMSESLNISEYPILKLSNDYREIPEDWLIIQILTLIKYRIEMDQVKGPFADFLNNCEGFQLLENNSFITNDDVSPKRLTIREFIFKYESPQSISILDIFEPHYKNFHSKIFGSMKEIDNREHIRHGIFKNRQSYSNFLISTFDINVIEGII